MRDESLEAQGSYNVATMARNGGVRFQAGDNVSTNSTSGPYTCINANGGGSVVINSIQWVDDNKAIRSPNGGVISEMTIVSGSYEYGCFSSFSVVSGSGTVYNV